MKRPGDSFEVFWRFLLLGCTSFGGPAAHLGYFRAVFVQRLAWLDETAFARLIALSQFLPGPGSSQVGFAIGLQRAGLAGGVAAFLGFTLPSFLLLFALAVVSREVTAAAWFGGLVAGLKLLALVVVADATLGMYRAFCGTVLAAGLCVATAMVLLVAPGVTSQLAMLLLAGAVAGLRPAAMPVAVQRAAVADGRVGRLPMALFAVLFLGLPLVAAADARFALFARFYEAGALVFGGGHVVLPLLREALGPTLSADAFLTAYAAAQAVPGPMFTIASFLGASLSPDAPLLGALLGTVGIFLPGLMLVLALRGAWDGLASRPRVAAAAAGINASVVGLLLAALYAPVFVSAVQDRADLAAALAGLFVLMWLRPPILVLVAGFACYGVLSR
ncbi:MAG TPA: chromate efflux transporter [Pseudomonadales bacterium]|nr:chromate efflux transporter [Pseudomonadales bacterium]